MSVGVTVRYALPKIWEKEKEKEREKEREKEPEEKEREKEHGQNRKVGDVFIKNEDVNSRVKKIIRKKNEDVDPRVENAEEIKNNS